MVEKLSRVHLAVDAETHTIGKRTVGHKNNPAVIVPDGLVSFCLAERRGGSASETNQECDASEYVVPETHEWRLCKRDSTIDAVRRVEKRSRRGCGWLCLLLQA